jgi:hypothetical protein
MDGGQLKNICLLSVCLSVRWYSSQDARLPDLFRPAILSLGYVYPWGYARSLQGVRQILNLLKISLYKSNISLKI